jgi:uncharacterized protein (UPF0371 family)
LPKRKAVVEVSQGIITESELETTLSTAQPIIRQFFAALIEENRKAQADIVKGKAKKITQEHRTKAAEDRIAALEKELEELHKNPPFLTFLKAVRESPDSQLPLPSDTKDS